MRILQAMAGAEKGGAERFFERLVPALGRAGVEQRVLLRPAPAREALLREAGIGDVHTLAFGGRFDLATKRSFARHIADFAPDVVMTWMSRATRHAPTRPAKTTRPLLVARLGGYYDLKYYRACDHLIGDTEDIVTYLTEAGWPADRASYLPNFVNDAPGRALPRSAFSISETAPVLLALGRLHPNKGFDVLLKALAQVPGAYLLLAGDGPEAGALDALATQLGIKPRVRFLGWRDDIANLFATAHLLVHPARHEPLGNVILEAWAHRLPIVCTAAQGPAVLVENGVNGLIVPIEDPQALAAAIRAALDAPEHRRSMVEAGRARFERDFNETAVVAKYIAFFEKLLG